jgi:hypothetical protein
VSPIPVVMVEFSHFIFDIYRRKKQSLRWTGNVWTTRKMLLRMLGRHTRVRMKKKRTR